MTPPADSPRAGRSALREILLYGLCCGVLVAALKLGGYQLLVVDRSVEGYVALVAVLFVVVGLWLGATLRRKPDVVVKEVPVPAEPAPFARNEERTRELGLTPREVEILGLIALGLSNREIAGRLFVSENTVKTHASRVFDKLGARRRTEAVQMAKVAGVIP